MNATIRFLLCAVATVWAGAIGCAERAVASPMYHVTYLGFAFTNGIEAKINNLGQVVGSDGVNGFIDDAGHITNLDTLGSSNGSRPTAINDAGQVAGYSTNASRAVHGFLYSGGSLTDLGAVPGFSDSRAFGLNTAGDVVGRSSSASGTSSRAFLYHNGTLTDLGSGQANAINASGTIVGTTNNLRAVLYQNGSVIDLGNFGDSPLTYAVDINDAGQIVGDSDVLNPATGKYGAHPFIYESGVWRDLGLPAGLPLAMPSAINNLGQIVGNSNASLGSANRPPFVYTDGTIYNLDTLLDASGTGLSLELAYDINDRGVILAEGSTNSGYQAVLLTPVPEPSSMVLFLVGGMVIGGVAVVRRTVQRSKLKSR